MDVLDQWLAETYDADEIREIAEHGCKQGVHGLIYYSETSVLYDTFRKEIWEVLDEYAQDIGSNVLEMVHGEDVATHDQFAQYLVWMAVELAAIRRVTQ